MSNNKPKFKKGDIVLASYGITSTAFFELRGIDTQYYRNERLNKILGNGWI